MNGSETERGQTMNNGNDTSAQGMSKNEILRQIKSEESRIAWRIKTIEEAKADIRGCRKAIAFWNKELKKLQKKAR